MNTRNLLLSVSLIIAEAVYADGSSVNQTIAVNRNSTLYVADLQESTNGLQLKYIYSPDIVLSQGLLDSLNNVLPVPYNDLLPTVANDNPAVLFNYISAGISLSLTAKTTDWSNFLAVINNVTIFPGSDLHLSVFDNSTGNFVEISQDYTTVNSYETTDSYRFLTSITSDSGFVYIDGVLTKYKNQTLVYDNIDIKGIALSKEVLLTGMNNVLQPNSLRAWVENGILHVSGLAAGETWNVYNAAGMLIYQNVAGGAVGANNYLPLQSHGVYFIKQGNNAVKVVY